MQLSNSPNGTQANQPHDPDWTALAELPPGAPPSPEIQAQLAGKRVLITGAAGSIGSALARRIAGLFPASLILLDTSEHALYELDRTLDTTGHTAVLGSVTDQPLLTDLFRQHRPQFVFHAAALKHVPLMERNPFAAITANALGTYTLAETAAAHYAQHLLLVSTDKAVDPTSLMGASKRIAELVTLTLGTRTTRMTALRLGNVLGSQGSVVPLFLEQIARGGPITVTHPEARRYFLSMEAAVHAILATLAAPPDHTLLIPHLGAPIHIADLAQHLLAQNEIAQHSAAPIEIAFTALRPGDKLEESLLATHERWLTPEPSGNALRAIASPTPTPSELHAALATLQQAVLDRDLPHLFETILRLVPEYTPSALLAPSTPILEPAQEPRA